MTGPWFKPNFTKKLMWIYGLFFLCYCCLSEGDEHLGQDSYEVALQVVSPVTLPVQTCIVCQELNFTSKSCMATF